MIYTLMKTEGGKKYCFPWKCNIGYMPFLWFFNKLHVQVEMFALENRRGFVYHLSFVSYFRNSKFAELLFGQDSL